MKPTPAGHPGCHAPLYSAILAFWLTAILQSALAQDLTIGTVFTYDITRPAQTETSIEPLVLKKSPRPPCPSNLRNHDTYAYILVCSPGEAETEQARSRIHQNFSILPRGYTTDKELATRNLKRLRDWKWIPEYPDEYDARRALVPVIFNPASAPASGKNAAPRLLDVRPVMMDKHTSGYHNPPRANFLREMMYRNYLCWVTITVTANGEIKNPEIDTKSSRAKNYKDEITETLRHWKIAPARKNNAAIDATIKVPVIVIYTPPPPPETLSPLTKLTVIKRPNLAYPRALDKTNLRGSATVEFMLDAKGRPQNPVIVASDNEHFGTAALDAIRRYRFRIPDPSRPDTLGRTYTSIEQARWQYEFNFAPSSSRTNLMPGITYIPTSGIMRTAPSMPVTNTREHPLTIGHNVTAPIIPSENDSAK